jgi:hypothetical protein
MSFICPDCGKEYDATLFAFSRTVECDCGRALSGEHRMNVPRRHSPAQREARRLMRAFQREADEVAQATLIEDLPDIDLEIAINELRERCRELYPESLDLFEMIYESRFRRLREQWCE